MSARRHTKCRPHLSSTWIGEGIGATLIASDIGSGRVMISALFVLWYYPVKTSFFVSFSEESNIEYRTRNNECRRIREHLILNNAEEILPLDEIRKVSE